MLFWSQAQRNCGLRSIDRIYTVRDVQASGKPSPLEPGEPLAFDFDIDAHMTR